MADYGVLIKNPSGSVLIDGVYANLALRTSGVGVASTAASPGYTFTVTVTGGGQPVLAVACPQYCIVGSGMASGANTVFTVLCMVQNASVNWYVYDDPSFCTPFSTNWGLIVRNKNTGKVVFDSRMKYMKVIGFESGSAPEDPTNPFISKSYSVGKVAVVQCQKSYVSDFRVVSPPPDQQVMVLLFNSMFKVSTATLQAQMIITQQFTDSTVPPALNQSAYAFLILDISDL